MYELPREEDTPSPAEGERRRPGLPLEPRRVAHALRQKRRQVAVVTFFAALIGVSVAKLVVEPRYESFAVLAHTPDDTDQPPGDPKRAIRTLVDSVKLTPVLAEVRRELGLEKSLEALAATIQVDYQDSSDLVTIRASSDTAEGSVELADALVRAFLEHRRSLRREALEETVTGVGERLERARAELASAQTVWDAFREEHHLSDLDLEIEGAYERVNALRAEADLAGAVAEGESARAEMLGDEAAEEEASVVLSEVESQPLALRLAEARQDEVSHRASLGDQAPEVLAARAEVSALEQELARGDAVRAQRTVGRNPRLDALVQARSVSAAERTAAEQRRGALISMLRAAEGHLHYLRVIEGRARGLRAAVSAATDHVQEMEQAQLAARTVALGATADLSLIAPPTAPRWPARSLRKAVALAFPALALLLSVLWVIGREVGLLRLEAPKEIAFWSLLPVVLSTSSRGDGDDGERQRLLDDLVDALGEMAGETLVVAVDPDAERACDALFPPERSDVFHPGTTVRIWDGDAAGAPLRRACRRAERVLLVCAAGTHGAIAAAAWSELLGRERGVGVMVVAVGAHLATSADRAGDADSFWPSRRAPHVHDRRER